jgi:microcystin-dependent protein
MHRAARRNNCSVVAAAPNPLEAVQPPITGAPGVVFGWVTDMNRYSGLSRVALVAALGSIAAVAVLASGSARAATTIAPFSNLQPSLAITEVVEQQGVYPSHDVEGGGGGGRLGFVYDFAGDYAPHGSSMALGQILPTTGGANAALYSLTGAAYGGDGVSTFALPDLSGQAIRGVSTPTSAGEVSGTPTVAITTAQLPVPMGSGATFDNKQPALGMQTLIDVSGIYPTASASTFVGQIAHFAGNFVPGGWSVADGSLLSVTDNPELFAVIGTTYGGDGVSTFALPDLRGRLEVGADAAHPVGATFGADAEALTGAQIAGAPVDNDQASLSIEYLINTNGAFPTRDGAGFDDSYPTLGQIVEYAGGVMPTGYLPAEGQILPISQYAALFSILGFTYGGDGYQTFALPDFRGRTAIGAGGGYVLGQQVGADQVTLSVTTTSTGAVPEPATWTLMGLAFGLIGTVARRRRATLGLLAAS